MVKLIKNNHKLNKKETNKIDLKLKKGWKANILLPDYYIDSNGFLGIKSKTLKKTKKFIQFKESKIIIEKVIGRKNLDVSWEEIANVQKVKSKKVIQIQLTNGSVFEFELFKNDQSDVYLDYVISFISEKKLNNNSNMEMYN